MEKKYKIILGAIGAFIVVVVIIVSFFLYSHYKSVNLDVNNQSQNATSSQNQAIQDPKKDTSTTPKVTATTNKSINTASPNTNSTTTTNNKVNNTSNAGNVTSNVKPATIPAANSSNQYEKIFYNSMFGRNSYPQIINDNSNNIIKIYTVYALAYLNGMNKLGNNLINGNGNIESEKSNYYTALSNVNTSLGYIIPSINQIISISSGSQKQEAQTLLTVVQNASATAEAEYTIIKHSTGFGIPMVSSLPFGSSLNGYLKSLNSLNSSLGVDNTSALQNWENYCTQSFNNGL